MKEIELKVDGMTCQGCERRIKNVLKDIDGVEDVKASHKDKNVKIFLSKEVSADDLKNAIEDLDFEVID